MPSSDRPRDSSRTRDRELIHLALMSCIQKLAFLRGDGTSPRTFPDDERDVIAVFGLECVRLGQSSDSESSSHDESSHNEDTPPRARTRLRKAP